MPVVYNPSELTNADTLTNRNTLGGQSNLYSNGLITSSSTGYSNRAFNNPTNPASAFAANPAEFRNLNSHKINSLMDGAGGFSDLNGVVSNNEPTAAFNSNNGFQSNPIKIDGFMQKPETISNTLMFNYQLNPYEQTPRPNKNPLGSSENLKLGVDGNINSGGNPFCGGNNTSNISASNGFRNMNSSNQVSLPSNFIQTSSANSFSSLAQLNNRNQYNMNQSFSNPYSNNASTGFNSMPSTNLAQSQTSMNPIPLSTSSYYSAPCFSNPTNYTQSSFYFKNPNSTPNFPSNSSQMYRQSNSEIYLKNLPSQSTAPQFLPSAYSSTMNRIIPSSKPTNHAILKNPYKDPHGLTHIFPDEDPELVTEFKVQPFVPSADIQISIKQKEIRVEAKQQNEFLIFEPGDSLDRFNRSEKMFFFKSEIERKEKKIKCKRDFKEIKETINSIVKDKDTQIMFYVKVLDLEFKERLTINAYLSNNFIEIKAKVLEIIKSNQDFHLIYNKKVLTGLETIAELGIQEKSEVILESIIEDFPSNSHLPVTRLLKVTPSIEKMKGMRFIELKNIQNLTLENDHGKIVYECPVDVIEVNFDNFISFTNKQFISFPNGENPSNQKLNKPAFITLYNIKSRKSSKNLEIFLKTQCAQNQTEFINYNPYNHQFTFKIQNL